MQKVPKDRLSNGNSSNWYNYKSALEKTTCKICENRHGKIIPKDRYWQAILELKIHGNCLCEIVRMRTKTVGEATSMGKDGADYYLFYYKILPNYYITKKEAINLGWNSKKGNLSNVCPNKMLGGDIYRNKEKLLPDKFGRIWYEADIDYISGYRNTCRILYSNDGLIFVSYDHYQTFYEIIE